MQPDTPDPSPYDLILSMTRPDAPVCLDIRVDEDRAAHPGHIPGAVSVAFDDVAGHAALADGRGAVLICHKGLKLSGGAAARLTARGLSANRLSGGHVAWVSAGLPVCHAPAPTALALPLDATPPEIAATWAFARFVAPLAELLEVPRADLDGLARLFHAKIADRSDTPDLPGLTEVFSAADDPNSLFAVQVRGHTRPAAAFPHLDAAYRGLLLTHVAEATQ